MPRVGAIKLHTGSIEDEQNVNQRRAAIGLMRLELCAPIGGGDDAECLLGRAGGEIGKSSLTRPVPTAACLMCRLKAGKKFSIIVEFSDDRSRSAKSSRGATA
jgi:hypothetical protein